MTMTKPMQIAVHTTEDHSFTFTGLLTVEDIKKFSLDQHEQAQEPAYTRTFTPGERVRNVHTRRNGTVISYHVVNGRINVCRVLVVSWDGKPNKLEALATESEWLFEHIHKKFGCNE